MKRQLGQFFTTNSDIILKGFEKFVKGKEASDPFAGNQDLMNWAKKNGCKKAVGFDFDKKYTDNKKVFYNDSLNFPQKCKFVLTNPPYLHKNKADKKTKEKFFAKSAIDFEDLYQLSIFSVLDSEEGILIVPLNFLCAENSKKIRSLFFEKFEIKNLNIFSQPVFEDTTYNVISFYFQKKKKTESENTISAVIFPENKKISFTLEKRFNWQLGGDFIKKIKSAKNNLGIFRLTKEYISSGEYEVEMALQNIKNKQIFKISDNIRKKIEKNILFLRAIDSKNGKKIQLEDIRQYNVSALVGKSSSRNMAHLIFGEEVSIKEQLDLMEKFNQELEENRKKYFSFFLTNFRDNNRKRISFDFTYKFLNYLYYEKNSKQSSLF